MLAAVLITTTLALLAPSESTARPFTTQIQGLTSQLCFERPEDSGAMNAHPSTVEVSYNAELGRIVTYRIALGGGQAACVFVSPGPYAVMATSNHFTGPIGDAPSTPNSRQCRSKLYKVNLKERERITLFVWPARSKANGGGYSSCGWVLSRMAHPNPP